MFTLDRFELITMNSGVRFHAYPDSHTKWCSLHVNDWRMNTTQNNKDITVNEPKTGHDCCDCKNDRMLKQTREKCLFVAELHLWRNEKFFGLWLFFYTCTSSQLLKKILISKISTMIMFFLYLQAQFYSVKATWTRMYYFLLCSGPKEPRKHYLGCEWRVSNSV